MSKLRRMTGSAVRNDRSDPVSGRFHHTEQRVIETLHCIAAACGRGMKRIAKHTDAEASGKSGGLAQWRFWDTVLANRLIEDHWKRAHRHVSYPRSTAELIQYSRGMLHGNLVRSRSLDTLIVVKLCHAVLCAS